MSKRKQESKRLARVTMKLVYLTGNKFQYGIGIYAQAIDLALKVVGATEYTGHPRNFIKAHLDALEEHVNKHAKEIASIKKDRKTAKRPAKKTFPTLTAGVDVASDAFLMTYEWRKLRMQALKKYGPRCMCCGATPASGAVMNVDHIKPRKTWPSLALDINNLQILCHECNHGKGNWDQTDWRSKV